MNKSKIQILIDNSALSNLLKDEKLQKPFADRLASQSANLFISFDTVIEMLGGDIKKSCERFAKLGELYYSLNPQRIYFAKGISYALAKELKRDGRSIELPLVENSARWHWLRSALHDSSKVLEYRTKVDAAIHQAQEFSDVLAETDKSFRKRFKPADYPKQRLQDLSTKLSFADLEPFVDSFRGLTRRTARDILHSTSCQELYFYHRIHLVLLFVRLQGNTIVSFDDGQFDFLNPISRGNWFDLGYIALAAKMDLLITDDYGQRGITNLLCSKKIIQTQGVSLRDFLN